jgi:AraC-like DNA-binding protein
MTQRDFRRSIGTYMRWCFEHGTPPRVDELAAQLDITTDTLTKRFKTTFGVTPSTYFKRQQIARAKQLLRTTKLSISQVCRAAALGTSRTFHRLFRKQVGCSPESFRSRSTKCP